MNWTSFWIGMSVIPVVLFALAALLVFAYLVAFIILDAKLKASGRAEMGVIEAISNHRKRKREEGLTYVSIEELADSEED